MDQTLRSHHKQHRRQVGGSPLTFCSWVTMATWAVCVWMINKLFWSFKTDHDPLIMQQALSQDSIFVLLLWFFSFKRHFRVLSRKFFILQVANFTHFWTYHTIFLMLDKSYFRFCYFMTLQWSGDFESDISHKPSGEASPKYFHPFSLFTIKEENKNSA